MDAASHDRHLLGLERAEFLAAAAPAVLVRYRARALGASRAGSKTMAMATDEPSESMRGGAPDGAAGCVGGKAPRGIDDLDEELDETMPHGKFTQEPVEMELYPLAKQPGASLPDHITIGRTAHAYVRPADGWMVVDAGAKNAGWLGDVQRTFYRSGDLLDLMGGDHGRR